jgi:cytochrome b
MKQKILVWDLPTRVFHWFMAGSFAGAYYTADSERYRDIHVMLGYVVLGLMVFRIFWGRVGTRYAKFNSFLFAPNEIVAYMMALFQRDTKPYLGHNPAGSVAIWLLLLLGMISGVTGVMAFQDIGGDIIVEWHDLISEGMLGVVVIHILGVMVSSMVYRENLIRSMVTGYKLGEKEQGINCAHTWLGVVVMVVVIAFGLMYSVMA